MERPMRRERDALGPVEVPADALWGAQTQRAIANFPISGLRADPVLVRSIARIKQAAARTHLQLGTLPERLARAIDRAAGEFAEGQHAEAIVVDVFQAGAGTALHMNLNEAIANRANQILGWPLGSYRPVHPNDHVNRAQSTNDVFPTAMRLACLELGDALAASLDRLTDTLAAKACEFWPVLKAGRTHLQDAVPLRLGQEVGAWAQAVRRARATIEQALGALDELGLGGTAVGTGLNSEPGYRELAIAKLGELTGREGLAPAADPFEAMQSMAVFVTLSGALRGAAVELGRIANDVRLLASGPRTGLAELELPAAMPGSSIMPGKVNPSMAEMLNQVCFQVVGCDATVAAAGAAGQLELNVMMPVIAFNLLGALRILERAVGAFSTRCVEGITADARRCQRYAHDTVALATVLNPLVGYAQATEVVHLAQATGRSIPEVVAEKGLLAPEQLRITLAPESLSGPSSEP